MRRPDAPSPPALAPLAPVDRDAVDALFDAALDRPPDEWQACLDGAHVDSRVRDEVARLLAAHARAEGFLEPGALAVGAPSTPATPTSEWSPAAPFRPAPAADDRAPPLIGPYRPVRPLGRGGMGSVYLAERADGQFAQTVAIKILRRGLDTDDVVRRFVAERQILAALDHANVARLLDGGMTDDGRPYFVMEYVDGAPLDRWCDERRLAIDARVRLLRDVARAVHAAHRSLVVHRDLKPSNVMVTEAGEPKLLDFGIAKLLGADEALTLPATHTGPGPMTPEYASPEQVRGLPVTTATDVYGLGLVLFELLTGRRAQPLADRSAREIEAAVCLGEAPRMSAVVLRPVHAVDAPRVDAPTPESLADARGVTPARLSRQLRGDLDRIVAMALRKEPDRRYASAEQLAADLDAYLVGRPVAARGDSVPYRARKFVARHRWTVAAASAFVLVLAGYAATVTVQARRIERALRLARLGEERAEQVTAFTLGLFEAGDAARDDTLTARDLLRRGAERAERLRAQPVTQAQMLDVVGMAYLRLGDFALAERYLQRALALRRASLGAEHEATAESEVHLAGLYGRRGRYVEADALYRSALEKQRRLLGADHREVARTLSGLGLLHQRRGDYPTGERLAREALALRRARLGESHPDVAVSLVHLANNLQLQGRSAEAEPLLRQALALRQRLYDGEHVDVAGTMGSLAIVIAQRGAFAEAESLHRAAHAMRERLLGPDHPDVSIGAAHLGALLRRMERPAEAESLYRAAYAGGVRALGPDHPDVMHMVNGLALTVRDRGQLALADSLQRDVLARRRRVLGPTHPAVATSIHQLGTLTALRGDTVRAVALFRDALAMRRRALGDAHPLTAETRRELARLGGEGGLGAGG